MVADKRFRLHLPDADVNVLLMFASVNAQDGRVIVRCTNTHTHTHTHTLLPSLTLSHRVSFFFLRLVPTLTTGGDSARKRVIANANATLAITRGRRTVRHTTQPEVSTAPFKHDATGDFMEGDSLRVLILKVPSKCS